VVADATLVVFGLHAMVWGVITASLQQRLVPDRLRCQVGSVFGLLALGGAALGTLAGGFLADATTLKARSGWPPPTWSLTAAVWRQLTDAALSPPQPAPTL
jgi:MFS family permease